MLTLLRRKRFLGRNRRHRGARCSGDSLTARTHGEARGGGNRGWAHLHGSKLFYLSVEPVVLLG